MTDGQLTARTLLQAALAASGMVDRPTAMAVMMRGSPWLQTSGIPHEV